jgi:hypothetical protein
MTNHTDGELPEPAGPFDELASTGIDRRTLIKRAAVVGAAVAWSAPAVQILGARPAFAQTGTPPPEPEPECCPDMVRGTLFFEWNGQTCTQNPGTRTSRKDGSTLFPNKPCTDRNSCGTGPVYVMISGEKFDKHEDFQVLDPGGTDWTAGGAWSGGTWTSPEGNTGIVLESLNQRFAITSSDWDKTDKDFAVTFYTSPQAAQDDFCQKVVMHISCSDKALQGPVYRYGGLVFYEFRPSPSAGSCKEIKE